LLTRRIIGDQSPNIKRRNRKWLPVPETDKREKNQLAAQGKTALQSVDERKSYEDPLSRKGPQEPWSG